MRAILESIPKPIPTAVGAFGRWTASFGPAGPRRPIQGRLRSVRPELLASGQNHPSSLRDWFRDGFLVALSLALFSAPASAEVYITVTGANVKRAKIALGELKTLGSGGDAGLASRIARQAREDLELLNLFDFIDYSLFSSLDAPSDIYKMRYSDWSLLQASFVLRYGYKVTGGKISLEAVLHDVPGAKRIFSRVYQYPPAQWERMVHAMAEDVLKSITGESGLFFSRVLMACTDLRRRNSPPREIYVTDADGSNLVQLTADGTISLSPAWSPDGKIISYSQYEFRRVGGSRQKVQALKTHDLRNGKRRVLSARKGVNSGAAWSPDGRKVAATMSFTGRPEIYLFDPSNPSAPPEPLSRNIQWRKISGLGFQRESVNNLLDVEPAWSPDGKKIVLSSARTGHPMIYIVDLGSKQASQLTFAGTYNASPAWSPRGDKIVFAAQRLAEGNFDLYLIDPDGNNLSRLTNGTAGGRKVNSENPSWAPTGRHIAFASNEDGHYAIYVMTVDGRIKRRISPEGKDCKTPAWSAPPP